MNRFFKSAAFRIFAAVLAALLAGSVMSVASRSGSSTVTKFTSMVFGPASKFAGAVVAEIKGIPVSFRSSSYLKRENDRLQNQVDELREQLVDYEQMIHEVEFYREFLELKEEHEDYEFVQASVIGRDAADRFGTLTLSKGSAAGVKVNDPVIYGRYLVGVVTAVTPTGCTVNTLLNPNLNVSAYESRSAEVSYVSTTVELSADGNCRMEGLSPETAVATGGLVCTAGVSGIYPKDLIIGTVTDVVDATSDISAWAIVEPGVDYSQLTDVLIITSFSGQAK